MTADTGNILDDIIYETDITSHNMQETRENFESDKKVQDFPDTHSIAELQ